MFNRVKNNIAVIVMIGVLTFALAACGAKEDGKSKVEIANPSVDVSTLDEAAKISGFTMNAPDSLSRYEGTTIQVIENDLIQVIYGKLDHNVYFRKRVISDGDTDISGDYNDYKNVEEKTFGDKDITVKGDDEQAHVIIWNDGNYCYSIQSDEGFKLEDVEVLLQIGQ